MNYPCEVLRVTAPNRATLLYTLSLDTLRYPVEEKAKGTQEGLESFKGSEQQTGKDMS